MENFATEQLYAMALAMGTPTTENPAMETSVETITEAPEVDISLTETPAVEVSLTQAPKSLKDISQSTGSDGESDTASESTVSASTTRRNSISQPHDCHAIGSDLWSSEYGFSEDSKQKFFGTVNWQALALIATDYRDGIQCSYADADAFSTGQFNMVRRLDFADGVRWVARVRLPREATYIPLERYDSARAFEIEVASMKFFKSKSTIPVPEVFVYNQDPSNHVGAPYMLIEYIHGTTASKLGEIRSTTYPVTYGTPEQDRKFRRQMAKIQAEVLMFQFPKIGSLYYDKDKDDFYIGREIETGRGPWTSSADYYRDLADVLMKEDATRYYRNPEKEKYFCAPLLLSHLMSIHTKVNKGPYNLINRDFGPHNVLVDNEFNIVGVIDFDGVFAAPPEAVAQYPRFFGLDVEAPGIVATKPAVIKRIEYAKPKLAEYRRLLMEYEAALNDGNATISSLLGSRSAIIHSGFDDLAAAIAPQYETWFTSALSMLREYCKE